VTASGPEQSPGLGKDARVHLEAAKEGLQWILKTLDGSEAEEFALASAPPQRSTAAGRRKKK
jgi:hypothetical protein